VPVLTRKEAAKSVVWDGPPSRTFDATASEEPNASWSRTISARTCGLIRLPVGMSASRGCTTPVSRIACWVVVQATGTITLGRGGARSTQQGGGVVRGGEYALRSTSHCTRIVPVMPLRRCWRQRYWYVPGLEKV
jgi:hypothetical protein